MRFKLHFRNYLCNIIRCRQRQLLHAVLHEFVHLKQIVVPVVLVHHEHLHEILKVVRLLEEDIGQLQFADRNQAESHGANGQLEFAVLFRFECAELRECGRRRDANIVYIVKRTTL